MFKLEGKLFFKLIEKRTSTCSLQRSYHVKAGKRGRFVHCGGGGSWQV